MELKLDHTVNQLRSKLKSSLDIIGSNVKKMFEQVMLKMDSSSKGIGVEESCTIRMIKAKLKAVLAKGHMELPQARMEQAERVETSKFTTKYIKLKCPKFDGSNF